MAIIDPQIQINKFKELLDFLPFLSEGEKAIACTLFVTANEEIKMQMVKFYEDQLTQHNALVKERQESIDAAQAEFFQNIKTT